MKRPFPVLQTFRLMGSSCKRVLCLSCVLAFLKLWPVASALHVDCTARESVDSRYARGLLFIDSYDIGVKHCYLTGSIHRPDEDTKQELTKRPAVGAIGNPSRLSMFLISRAQADGSVIVSA